MEKKIIIIIAGVLIILGLVGGGYLYLKFKEKPGDKILKNAEETTNKIIESATKGALPSIQTNVLENKPDINPADKANPYTNIKTNPFE
jgi:flagellar basal body-associated protein FliL